MKTTVKFTILILVLSMTLFIAYDADIKGKRPAILVVPEWWGLNDYPKSRARQLVSLGYIAMAVDMYGNGKIAADPKEAQALARTFYQNPQLGKTRLEGLYLFNQENHHGGTSFSNEIDAFIETNQFNLICDKHQIK
jgi:hypothetical protein